MRSRTSTADGPDKVIITTKYPWAPLVADIALFANGIVPKNYGGESEKEFYTHPVGTGPFKWDYWHKGAALKLIKNPHYWQKGKPYLDSVTWTAVGNDNTRQLQLKGGQAQIDEFPPWSSTASSLKTTPGVTLHVFPSTRTDYLMLNERYAPLPMCTCGGRSPTRSTARRWSRRCCSATGKPANSFMPPQVPYYDPNSPGIQYNLAKAKQEMAQSKYPHGFSVQMLLGAGNANERAESQIIQQELQPLGIKITYRQVDPSVEFSDQQQFKYQLGFSYWTMDIADPDELVSFAVDPTRAPRPSTRTTTTPT